MLRADDEVGIEGAGGAGVRTVALELVEKPLDEVERRIGVDRVVERVRATSEAPEMRQAAVR